MERLGLGYGDANMLAMRAKAAAAPAATDAAPLDAIYSGAEAPLRALHEQLIAHIDKIGAYAKAPKKAYVSMRRKKQFAMLGPATKDQLELGLNAKGLNASGRLKGVLRTACASTRCACPTQARSTPSCWAGYARRTRPRAECRLELLSGWCRSRKKL